MIAVKICIEWVRASPGGLGYVVDDGIGYTPATCECHIPISIFNYMHYFFTIEQTIAVAVWHQRVGAHLQFEVVG